MQIAIISLFPEMFNALQQGIIGRAQEQGIIDLSFYNPRDFSHDKHRTVDDRPYGGGPGMVMLVEPLYKAVQAAKAALGAESLVVYLSPQGQVLQQARINELAHNVAKPLILICGRYEGVDERILELCVDVEYSLGDYVLSGGELAAMVLIDALTRQLPGALGHEDSANQDSFSQNGLLDHPHYTRPEEFLGLKVPKVLLSGDHQAIFDYRRQQAFKQTWQKRQDLLQLPDLNSEQQQWLAEIEDQKQ